MTEPTTTNQPTKKPRDWTDGPDCWEAFKEFQDEMYSKLDANSLEWLRRTFISGYSAGMSQTLNVLKSATSDQEARQLLTDDANACIASVERKHND
jgi:hypothetical protein